MAGAKRVDALTLWCLSQSDIWTQFVNQYTNRALQLDSLETSHPIEVPVQRSSQVFCVCVQAGRQAGSLRREAVQERHKDRAAQRIPRLRCSMPETVYKLLGLRA
jgi:hypothetical protein